MKTARPYTLRARAAAASATRARILDAATTAFLERWYDEVTVASVARAAGVSAQTVVNHFGTKEGLFAAAVEQAARELVARRERAEPGDVPGLVSALVDDYEITGDATIRMLALEERMPVLRDLAADGRRSHREWVARMVDPGERLTLAVVATDVYTWKLLRRDRGLSRDATVAAMCDLLSAVLASRAPARDGDPLESSPAPSPEEIP
jgi:AcrR family transcriptional regulator